MATRTLGIQFPLQDDLDKNRLFQMDSTGRASVKSQLTFLLLTNKGERWYNPDFGTNLRRFIFEPNDNVTWGDVQAEIELAVARFIPNLSIVSMNYAKGDTEYSMVLSIAYVYAEGAYKESDLLSVTFSAST